MYFWEFESTKEVLSVALHFQKVDSGTTSRSQGSGRLAGRRLLRLFCRGFSIPPLRLTL